MIPIATALINGRPVTLEEKDGYYFYTFTADTQTVDIQHLGCIGETQITELQIEKNDHQTYYVPPDVTYHPMAEILREMTHVRLELTDPESDFRSSLLLTNQGLLTEFENGPTMTALKQTAASYERRFEGMEDGKTLVNYVQETKDGILSVLTSTTAKLVKSQEEEYYRSTSQTTLTGGTWQTSIPSRTTGQSIWRRYRDVYADGTKSAWKPSVNGVNITGDKGDQGLQGVQGTKGRGITAVVMEYGKTTSNTVPPTSWSSTPSQANVYPTKEYVWERERITWDMAPTTTYTTPRLSEVGNLARDFRVVNDTVNAYERIMGGTDDQGRLTRLTQQLQTNAGFKQAVTDKISGTETRVTQLAESWSVKHLNANGDVLTAINVATGGASIQAGSNKLVVTPTTTYIQNGTIKSAMIESLDASKITAGTLDASKANIANLNINSLVGNKSEFIRSGWNAINSRVSIDGTGLKVTHTDGSYTMIGANGLEMYIGSTGYRTNFLTNAYMITGVHNTQHLETYNKHRYDGMSFGHYIYTLPTVYRGRNYSAICSLSDVQFYDTASWVLQRVVSYVDQSRTLELRPYGKVAIVAYAIYVNTSSFALKSYPVSVSLTVTV